MDKRETREYIVRFVEQIENEEHLNRILNMVQKYYARQEQPGGSEERSDLIQARDSLKALAAGTDDIEKLKLAAIFLQAATR